MFISDKSKKRALFIINHLGKGGAERVVVNTANKMVELGNNVTIISIFNYRFYQLDERVKFISLSDQENMGKINKIMQLPMFIFKLNKNIDLLEKEDKFDLVTSHLPLSNIICKLSKINKRTLHVIHNVFSANEDKINKKYLKIILKLIYSNCKIVTVSKGVQEELLNKYSVNPKYIKTIYNPIDIAKIREMSKESLDIDYKYLLFCGRLTQIKRVDIIIKSFKESGLYKNYKLVILGDGELKQKLVDLCKVLEIDKYVIFAGWKDNVYKYMKNAEILLSASDFEAFPMNLIEAFACGTKVVSRDCDYGPREILVGEFSDFLVSNDNLDRYSEVIKKAINDYPQKPNLLISQFDTKNIVNEYFDTYKAWI